MKLIYLKKAFLIVFFILLTTNNVTLAADASLSWLPSQDQGVLGYKIYFGLSSRSYIDAITIESSSVTVIDGRMHAMISGLESNQTYYIAITSYNNDTESDYSIEVTTDTAQSSTLIPQDGEQIDFNQLMLSSYSNQDISGDVTVEDNGETVALAGNRWVNTEKTYTITPDTMLEFDFLSTQEGEIHGIGFDADDLLKNDLRIFQIFGKQAWDGSIPLSAQYTTNDMGTWVHFSIPIGQYYAGENMHLVFTNDHDAAPSNATSWFSNILVSEQSAEETITFNTIALSSYSDQDISGDVTVEDNGKTVALAGNRWVNTEKTYTITPDTVLEFDFLSTQEGEIHGIGFDEDDLLKNDLRIFQIFGKQTWDGVRKSPAQYTTNDMGTWVHFSIPIGQYYAGENMRLVFTNDHDAAPSNATSWFSNLTIVE